MNIAATLLLLMVATISEAYYAWMNLCESCQYVFEELKKDHLRGQTEDDALKYSLPGICSKLQDRWFQGQCNNYIPHLIKEAFTQFQKGLTPEDICKSITYCSEQWDDCGSCKSTMYRAWRYKYATRYSAEFIKRAFWNTGTCSGNVNTEKFKNDCSSYTVNRIKNIWFWMTIGIPPENICRSFGFCLKVTSPKITDAEACMVNIRHLEKMYEAGIPEATIQSTHIPMLCSNARLRDDYIKHDCKSYTASRIKNIKFWMKIGITKETICKSFGHSLSTTSSKINAAEFCVLNVKLIKKMRGEGIHEDTIKHTHLPVLCSNARLSDYHTQHDCRKYSASRIKNIGFWMKIGITPETICKSFGHSLSTTSPKINAAEFCVVNVELIKKMHGEGIDEDTIKHTHLPVLCSNARLSDYHTEHDCRKYTASRIKNIGFWMEIGITPETICRSFGHSLSATSPKINAADACIVNVELIKKMREKGIPEATIKSTHIPVLCSNARLGDYFMEHGCSQGYRDEQGVPFLWFYFMIGYRTSFICSTVWDRRIFGNYY